MTTYRDHPLPQTVMIFVDGSPHARNAALYIVMQHVYNQSAFESHWKEV